MSISPGKRTIVVASVALWQIVVGTGMGMIWKYQNESGGDGNPPSDWPGDSGIDDPDGGSFIGVTECRN